MFQILHLPGHSPGSIGLLNARDGILVSGDTLYQTDSELIDWYPGSSVRQMKDSVDKIRKLLTEEGNNLNLVLPGHNDVITSKEEIRRQCERHLEMASRTERVWLKALSRARARMILGLNNKCRGSVPEFVRNMMQH